MEAVRSSETLVKFYLATRRHVPLASNPFAEREERILSCVVWHHVWLMVASIDPCGLQSPVRVTRATN
jgi:hypothetical protein